LKKYILDLFAKAAHKLEYLKDAPIILDVPKADSHGDIACNVALGLSRALKKNPRQIAEEIIASLDPDANVITKMEIAGPGFINFFFRPGYLARIITEVTDKDSDFGKSDRYKGKKANVEFVSANPTGPLTVGHGRNAVVGDTVANILEWNGCEVDREYYFNNAGRQMRVLGDSVKHRYLELLGEDIKFPEDYYQGEYITDIARGLLDEYGDSLRDEDPEGKFRERAESVIFADIRGTLERLNIRHSVFYNENSLYEEGRIQGLLDLFHERGLSYHKDGAVWLKLSELGNEQDKVIVKSTGEPTYRLPDIAYHVTKYERGYDRIVDLFGSDHAATYPDVLAALKELGYDIEKMKVLIHQFVTIFKDGGIVKMSTRKANYITLDELIDWTNPDIVRYYFNNRTINSHLNFDVDLAKKQSDENPVFYLQYAHARICSIIRTVNEQELKASHDHLDLLITDEEIRLIKKIHQFEEVIAEAGENLDGSKICLYLEELAGLFHRFYTVCRIIGSEKNLAEARLALVAAVKIVLRNGLSVVGLSAPERM